MREKTSDTIGEFLFCSNPRARLRVHVIFYELSQDERKTKRFKDKYLKEILGVNFIYEISKLTDC